MAGFPTAVGQPNMSGGYIPTLYATMLLVEFYKATVFGAIANTDYEDELKQFGDTMRIRQLPDITSREYVKGQDLEYETPDPDYIDLVIDKGRYWAMAINALDKKQSDLAYIQKWAEHASIKQKVKIDGDVLENTYSSADSNNSGSAAGLESGDINLGVSGTPKELTTSNIVDFIVECGVVLDEQNVPDEDRWFVLPSWACGKLKSSDLKDASLTGDATSPLRNGLVGKVDRFQIFMSNNLYKVTDGADTVTNAMFGHKSAISFASQMTDTEELPNPKDFGILMRSLQAYGYKVVKPEALGHAYITKG